ncbi:sulfatase family protein [Rhodopirellula europaea]|uniref:Heparan N-sulfatase n=1 Tax=Rhodopirellula europaea 6C TaxID=1263867 RepID=M2A7I3_9BACT|nr:sulfatase [Rhodopirellula europaea]EMB17316.1 heparan N-sulfatase [Rhodopirellula europaea 6C]
MVRIHLALLFALTLSCVNLFAADRSNVLVAISDDQSFPHTSAYGYQAIHTPAFDRVARTGVLFNNAFTPSPGCSPMRAAFLTGRNIWEIEHAGTHASSFATKYEVYQDRLEKAGYFVGYTGKGWGPGNWKISDRSRNPAGPSFATKKSKSPGGISGNDYAANFDEFLEGRPEDQPFSFWFGCHEPHRSFEKGIGLKNGMDPSEVVVPEFLPDTPEIRSDILDYCFEIQWFDQHLGRMIDSLEKAGELDNTIVIVTSDNGMAFPRAKANVYEYGIHMPLAISWPNGAKGGRVVDDLVNLIDVTATIYDATEVQPPEKTPLSGRSLVGLLRSDKDGIVDATRDAIFSGRERHSSVRYESLGYPQRCIRTDQYLYIRNFRPERWPAGAPQKFGAGSYPKNNIILAKELGPMHEGYHDIDGSPSLSFLVENHDDAELAKYLQWAVAKRPSEELYDIQSDPACLNDLASKPDFADVKAGLSKRLNDYLTKTNDPRVSGPDGGDIWETYPRYSGLRWFPEPEWATESPERVPKMEWLDQRRPKKQVNNK